METVPHTPGSFSLRALAEEIRKCGAKRCFLISVCTLWNGAVYAIAPPTHAVILLRHHTSLGLSQDISADHSPLLPLGLSVSPQTPNRQSLVNPKACGANCTWALRPSSCQEGAAESSTHARAGCKGRCPLAEPRWPAVWPSSCGEPRTTPAAHVLAAWLATRYTMAASSSSTSRLFLYTSSTYRPSLVLLLGRPPQTLRTRCRGRLRCSAGNLTPRLRLDPHPCCTAAQFCIGAAH